MLDSIYRTNGYKVGLFSSPHLVELGERIRINGQNISQEDIEEWVENLKPVAQKMEEDGIEGHPTFFEFMTAIAFLYFKKNKVDLAIFETGLGGRLDSTNVVIPKISIITTISKDHCSILGNTLESIAEEKAGIIKDGVPVIIGSLPLSASTVIDRIATERGAALYKVDNMKMPNPPITNLKGSYQQQNAMLAYHACKLLKEEIQIEENLCNEALKRVDMMGRWQIINTPSKIILDACHNSAGADCLRENLETLPEKPEVWVGILGEDRAPDIMDVIQSHAYAIKIFEVQQPRACSFSFLRSLIPKSFEGEILDFDLKKAKAALFRKGLKKTILVTGSIYLIGDILSIIQKTESRKKIEWNDLF